MSLLEVVGDANGDGSSDFIAREPTTDDLYLYVGYGYPGPARKDRQRMERHGRHRRRRDFNGDGRPDLLSVRKSTGERWLYKGDTFSQTRQRIGTGWNVMDVLFSTGDFDSDGNPDLIARERATGDLWFYPGNGTGSLLPRVTLTHPAGGTWPGLNALA